MTARGMINVGFGNLVPAGRVVAVVHPDSSPSRRLRADARDADRLIDATQGRRTRSFIVLDSNHLVLSPVAAETINHRFEAALIPSEEAESGR